MNPCIMAYTWDELSPKYLIGTYETEQVPGVTLDQVRTLRL